MTNKYYYLVASMPTIAVDSETVLSKEDFLYECGKWLTPEDMNSLLAVDLTSGYDAAERSTVVLEWEEFDTDLRKKLALARQAKKNNSDYKEPDTVKDILEQETPLLIEDRFEQIRLAFIDNKIVQFFYDLNWLTLYFLKVQIIERLKSFDKDKGEHFFYNLCEVKYEQTSKENR